MVSQNDRRTRAVKSARTARRLTVRQGAPRPATPRSAAPAVDVEPDESQTVDAQPTETPATETLATDRESGPEEAPEKAASQARQPTDARRWRIAAWLLVFLLTGAVAAAAAFGRQWYDQRQLDAARQQALAAARQDVVDFVSINAATVDHDLQRIADHATGGFKDEFTQDMPQVREAVVENKVVSQGTALRAAIVSANRHTAVVLVAVDATVRNANVPDGRLTHYRVEVTLVPDGHSGQWLISNLEFVG